MKKLILLIFAIYAISANAQSFSLQQVNDSLSRLILTTDNGSDYWMVRYPVYRFCVADVNGDGIEEALVGVIKSTRYFHDIDKRLFIYKNINNRIDRLWMGSRVGGKIIDFNVKDGKIVCVSKMEDDNYVVAEFTMARFGLEFIRFLAENVSENEAMNILNQL